MTFEEAQEEKSKLPESYIFKQMKYTVKIVPQANADFHNYCSAYRIYKISDTGTKKYSLDKQYTVMGISRIFGDLFYDQHPAKTINK